MGWFDFTFRPSIPELRNLPISVFEAAEFEGWSWPDFQFCDWGMASGEVTDVMIKRLTRKLALERHVPREKVVKQARKLRKAFEQLAAIDFFPGEAQRQTAAALSSLEADAARAAAPDEPHAVAHAVERLDAAHYQGRVWATRRRPWVDRLASAWLIRRFIDREARFVWLKSPADCPRRAIGFDFDGATFSHIGAMVTFETLLASFDLRTPALSRLGVLVHGLDAGGVLPPEAPGVERVLAGMREAITDDDQLLLAAAGVFEGLLVAFENEKTA